MNLLVIWDADYPWDVRVEKICSSLIFHGHEVHLVCRNQRRSPSYEYLEGLHIHRIKNLPAMFGKLNDLFTFPFFLSPVWHARISGVLRRYAIDVIIVRDLPMCPAALIQAKLWRIKCIFDMAEVYPAMLRMVQSHERFRLSNWIVRNPKFAELVESFSLSAVDMTWVMVKESRDRLLEKGVAPEKIAIVSNTPRTDKTGYRPKIRADGCLAIIYTGLVNPARGLGTAFNAIKLMKSRGMDVRLVIVGSGKYDKEARDLVSDLGIGDRVKFCGWVDHKELGEYIEDADIGLVPHPVNDHTNTTIPNKLFDYMVHALPVLVTEAKPLARIVREEKCGLVYNWQDAESLVESVTVLLDQDVRTKMGGSGFEAIREKYNWDIEAKTMESSLLRLASDKGSPAP